MNFLEKITERYKTANDNEAQRILDVMVMHEDVEFKDISGSWQAFDPDDESGRHAISSDWERVHNDLFGGGNVSRT